MFVSTAGTEQTWFKRTGSAADRFDYLYSEEELAEWAGTLASSPPDGAENVYAMFNNNGVSEIVGPPTNLLGEGEREEVAQAPTNAAMLKELLAA